MMPNNIKKPIRTSMLLENLVNLIFSEKTELLSVWIKRTKLMRGSYEQLAIAELAEIYGEFLAAFLTVLRSNDFLNPRIFIEKLSRIRSAQGFRLSEIQRAYYCFYEVAEPRVMQWDAEGTANEEYFK